MTKPSTDTARHHEHARRDADAGAHAGQHHQREVHEDVGARADLRAGEATENAHTASAVMYRPLKVVTRGRTCSAWTRYPRKVT